MTQALFKFLKIEKFVLAQKEKAFPRIRWVCLQLCPLPALKTPTPSLQRSLQEKSFGLRGKVVCIWLATRSLVSISFEKRGEKERSSPPNSPT